MILSRLNNYVQKTLALTAVGETVAPESMCEMLDCIQWVVSIRGLVARPYFLTA